MSNRYQQEIQKDQYHKVLSHKYNDYIYCTCPYTFYNDIKNMTGFKYDYDTGLCKAKILTYDNYCKMMRYQGVIFQRPETIRQYRDKQRIKSLKR